MTQKLMNLQNLFVQINWFKKTLRNFVSPIDSYLCLISTTNSLLIHFPRNSFWGEKLQHILKLSQRIFNYFSKIKSSKFCKKDILPVLVTFVLDLIKTSVQHTLQNNFQLLNTFAKSSIVDVRLGSEYASELSIKSFSLL